jgi:hypothetical protein
MHWGTKRTFYEADTSVVVVPLIHLGRVEGLYMSNYDGDGMIAAELVHLARRRFMNRSEERWNGEDFLKGIEHMRLALEPYIPPEAPKPRRAGCLWAALTVGFWVTVFVVLFYAITKPTNRVPQTLSSEPALRSNPG